MSTAEKPKRRNSEKRKEKSRDAARCRRNQETGIFYELAHELPISYSLLSQLDKASVIRLSITHLKLRQLLANVCLDDHVADKLLPIDAVQKLDQQYYKSIDGFLLVVTRTGDIIYVSENVEKYLGLTQVDMLGHSVIDFAHPCDHDELHDLISGKLALSSADDRQRTLFVRMKCTLTSKGRNINIKSSAFKVIHYSGKLLRPNVDSANRMCDQHSAAACTVLIGRLVPGLASLELALDRHTFVSRHSLDLRFVYCDNEVGELLGYSRDDLIGKSVFSYHHAFDAELLDKAFKALFAKGQALTGLYRFLAKNGGYVWMETRATVIGDTQLDRAKSVVCINHVISDVECDNLVLADIQHRSMAVDSARRRSATAAAAVAVGSVDENDKEASVSLVIEEDANEIIVCDENDDNDDDTETSSAGMQFVTEKLVGGRAASLLTCPRGYNAKSPMLSAVSSHIHQTGRHSAVESQLLLSGVVTTLQTVASNSSLDNMLDDLDCGMEMRAPYIPMDDMIFASSAAESEEQEHDQETTSSQQNNDGSSSSCSTSPTHSSTASPIDLTTSNTIDVDVMNALFSCARPTSHCSSSSSTVDSSTTRSKRPLLDQCPPLECPLVVERPLGEHIFNIILPSTTTSKVLRLTSAESSDELQHQIDSQTATSQTSSTHSVGGSSVLLNLLTTGVDTNWGYRLRDTLMEHQPNDSQPSVDGSTTPMNMALTALLHHLLNPSSPADTTGVLMTGGGSSEANINCVSGTDLMFHVTQLPSSTK